MCDFPSKTEFPRKVICQQRGITPQERRYVHEEGSIAGRIGKG